MKKLLLLTALAGSLLVATGCVDEVAYSRGPQHRPGYYNDRRTTTYVESRPVYRDRPGYYRDRSDYYDSGYNGYNGYDSRRDVRVYGAPRPSHSDVRVVF